MQPQIANNESSNSASRSNSSYFQQIFKGIFALGGLTVVGGAIYWVSSWLGGKAKNDEFKESGSVVMQNDKAALTLSSDGVFAKAKLFEIASDNFVEPVKYSDLNLVSKVPESDVGISNQNFFDDDLEYRSSSQLQGGKLLNTFQAVEAHYLAAVDLRKITNGWGVKINGEGYSDMSGYSVAAAGDFNGDGLDDLVIGAPIAKSNSGITYVVFGKNMIWGSLLKLSNLNGTDGFKINGDAVNDQFGWSVTGAGDINSDGIDDLVVGAHSATPDASLHAGISYVIFGKSQVWTSPLQLSILNGTNGFKINGETGGDISGDSVSGAGDINGDGKDDLVIGTWAKRKSYVVFGKKSGWQGFLNLTSLNGVNGFKVNTGGLFRQSVSYAGDVNGDGMQDLLIGNYQSPSNSYVIFGKNASWITPFDVATLNGVKGFRIIDGLNQAVSCAGDVNGDGIEDIVIGSYTMSPSGRSQAGISYVIFGKKAIWSSTFSLSNLNGTNGFIINGELAGDYSGFYVKNAGDINRDGLADLVIGAPQASPYGRTYAGASYIVFGKNSTWTNPLELSSLNGMNGFKINGEAANDQSGTSVSAAGDINDDGFADFVIGAPSASPPGRTNAGITYLIFGGDNLTLVNNTLNLYQGRTINITNEVFAATSTFGDFAHRIFTFTISNPQHGYFTVNNTATGTFTNRDIASGWVRFVHDNQPNAPSYQITADDGLVGTDPVSPVINFVSKPFIVNNHLTINQGQSIIISNAILSANIFTTGTTNADPEKLVFFITDLQRGRFADVANLNSNITSFVQAKITNSSLVFIHDNSQTAPSYKVSVSDGVFTTVASPATINFDAFPILGKSSFAIAEGQIITITDKMLSASDVDSEPTTLQFIMGDIQHANFMLVANQTTTPVTTFLQNQIAAGVIQLKHDGSQIAPRFNISVSDGILTTNPAIASIQFDVAPVLEINKIIIGQGATLILTSSMLSANDIDSDTASLIFTASEMTHGKFESAFNPGVAITQFTQSQVGSKLIRFIHDNSFLPPTYQISISDGTVATTFQNATVIFDLAPVLGNNKLTIGQGQEIIITSAMLSASDLDTNCSSLIFRANAISHGQFSLSADTSVAKTEFTQDYITSGKIKFIHDGTNVAPSYQISVDDGIVALTPVDADITFYNAPVLLTAILTVNQGQTVVLTNSMLNARGRLADAKSIIFKLSNVMHGKFTFTNDAAQAVSSFTLQQIIDGTVQFVHDNSQTAPVSWVSVDDGFVTSASAAITIIFDAAPVLNSNKLSINQGETIVLTSSMLSASDQDSNEGQLIFKASDVSHGDFWIQTSNQQSTITNFTQEQIASENIIFVHDGSATPPAYKIIVSDGILSTDAQGAVITFSKSPKNNDAIIGSATGAGVSGLIGLGLWLFKKYIDGKLKGEFSEKNLPNEVCKAILERMKLSGCLGYMDFELIQEFRYAVNGLLQTLLDAGVVLEELDAIEQKELAAKVALQIEKALLPPRTSCNKFGRFFKDFCVAEITPDRIQTNAVVIAKAVSAAINNVETKSDTICTNSSESKANQNQSSAIEMTSISHELTSNSPRLIETTIQSKQAEYDAALRKITAIRDALLKARETTPQSGGTIDAKADAVGSSDIKLVIGVKT